MPFSIATWNINSVRLRAGLVETFLKTHDPDVLCLQEIKCMNDQFPAKMFRDLGYEFQSVYGQKGYHGVATISKLPLNNPFSTDYVSMGDTRHLAIHVELNGKPVRIHNFYVPAGGDEPDILINPKFDHKLKFIEQMKTLAALGDDIPAILVGDLNIAPYEHDVWSHKQMLKIVSHTPMETEGLLEVMRKGDWIDLMRQHVPPSELLYTWWSYRAQDWDAADRGRRLDHIWVPPNLSPSPASIEVLREARGWERPSDHVPVIARFMLE